MQLRLRTDHLLHTVCKWPLTSYLCTFCCQKACRLILNRLHNFLPWVWPPPPFYTLFKKWSILSCNCVPNLNHSNFLQEVQRLDVEFFLLPDMPHSLLLASASLDHPQEVISLGFLYPPPSVTNGNQKIVHRKQRFSHKKHSFWANFQQIFS